MPEIADSLRLLVETSLEKRGDDYVIPVPSSVVEDGTLSTDTVYRVALLNSPNSNSTTDEASSSEESTESPAQTRSPQDMGPPVEEGDVRTVTIDTLGDQGDGIARVERGFILIVPGTQPGDRAEVEVTEVKDSVAFAEPITEPKVQ